jgi:ABC-type phosphate transport system substrate-binding protein
VQEFSQTYPYVTFELSVMSSQDAIDAVASQDIDIALVAEPIAPDREDLEAVRIGGQAILMAVHPSNPIDELSWEQVRDVFSARVWDWAALDPQQQPREILVVSQHEGSVARSVFERLVMAGVPVTPRAVVAMGDELAGQLIAQEPAAIGYVSADLGGDGFKVLSIAGTTPGPATVASGAWPIARPLNLVRHIDANVYVLDFLDFSRNRSNPKR